MKLIISIILYIGIACISAQRIRYAYNSKINYNRIIVFLIVLFALSLIAAFRYNTGTDSEMYRMAYKDITSAQRWQDFETGYLFLCSFLKIFSFPYQILFFLMEFLTTLFVLLLIKREKKYINVSVSVFVFILNFYLTSFDMMRQGLAVSIVLYAFSLYMDKKYKRSLILIVIASLFHRSAWIGMAVIGVKLLFENRRSKVWMFLCFSILTYIVLQRQVLGNIVLLLTRNKYYASYITRDAATDATYTGYIIKNLPLFLISTVYLKKYYSCPRFLNYYSLMIIGYIISMLGVATATQVHRLGYYFSYLDIVIYGYCANRDCNIGKIKIKKKIVQFCVIAYVLALFFYNTVYRNFSNMIPYQGFFPK